MQTMGGKKFTLFWLGCALLIFISIMAFATSNNSNNSDFELMQKIKTAFSQDEFIHAQKIDVAVENKIVILTGTVDAETEASRAIEIAASTPDVKKVNATELYVYNSSQPLTDSYITAQIKGIFLRYNLNTKAQKIPIQAVTVETRNGTVYLKGHIKSHGQQAILVRLAKSIDGVKKVKSSLKIKK